MRDRRSLWIGAALVAVWLPGIAAAATVVPVDCAAGQRIQAALDGAPAGELVVEVRGMCEENVVVERNNVTLLGADAAADGVRAPAGSTLNPNAAVTVRDAHHVRLEHLTLTGGAYGLVVRRASDTVTVKDLRITGNTRWGVSLDGGSLFFTDTTVSGNPTGGLYVARGLVNCYTCQITNNTGIGSRGLFVGEGTLSMIDSTVKGSAIGLELDAHASAVVDRSTVSGTSRAVSAFNSVASLYSGWLDGGVYLNGGRLNLVGMTQLAAPYGNTVTSGGFMELRTAGTVKTKLVGTTRVDRFSHGSATGAILETLQCVTGADLWCDAATTAAAASCNLCRRP